jgi:hypothetical protein
VEVGVTFWGDQGPSDRFQGLANSGSLGSCFLGEGTGDRSTQTARDVTDGGGLKELHAQYQYQEISVEGVDGTVTACCMGEDVVQCFLVLSLPLGPVRGGGLLEPVRRRAALACGRQAS